MFSSFASTNAEVDHNSQSNRSNLVVYLKLPLFDILINRRNLLRKRRGNEQSFLRKKERMQSLSPHPPLLHKT
jgi:hypothetical protein